MNIIIAPHPDDEIIGCFEVIKSDKTFGIIYTSNINQERKLESLNLKKFFHPALQIFTEIIPPTILENKNTFYFPDPYFEIHPSHRFWGSYGERLLREGLDIIFYSVNMSTPYIHESKFSELKENILNSVYPSQASLWKYEKKYIIFEGYNKWIM